MPFFYDDQSSFANTYFGTRNVSLLPSPFFQTDYEDAEEPGTDKRELGKTDRSVEIGETPFHMDRALPAGITLKVLMMTEGTEMVG